MDKDKKQKTSEEKIQDALQYPGVAVNDADHNDVDGALERERTRTLNNNPRNSDM